MKNLITGLVALIGLVAANSVLAVPYTFSAGQVASAQQVNANFQSLEDRVSVYDFRDYAIAANVTSKTFNLSPAACGSSASNTETRSYTRTPDGVNTNVEMTRQRLDGAVSCQTRIYNYVSTPNEYQLLSRENWNAAGTNLNATFEPAVAVGRRNSMMVKGVAYGTGTTTTTTPAGGDPADSGVFIETNVVLGLEDVTVPAGAYSNCLKIQTNRSSNDFNAFQRVAWFCDGVGEVKRVQLDNALVYHVWELVSVATAP